MNRAVILMVTMLALAGCAGAAPPDVTAQQVAEAFNTAGLGVTDIATPERSQDSPLPNSFESRVEFVIGEVAPKGGQVFVCDTKQNCDAIYPYFDALKGLAGPYLYQSPNGRVVAQLNSGLSPETAAQFEEVVAEYN